MNSINWTELQQVLAHRFESVELLALSGRIHDQASFDRAVDRLSCVLPVRGLECATSPFQRFAADDAQRGDWLANMNSDGARNLLLGVRGGYGITRLLESAPLSNIAKRLVQSRSVLCGHSDFTALHMALLASCLRQGTEIPLMLQGPMLCVDWGAEAPVERTFSDFMRVLAHASADDDSHENSSHKLAQKPVAIESDEHSSLTVCLSDSLRALKVDASDENGYSMNAEVLDGMVWGGNLSMICALLGTPYMPELKGGLLFIEDVNEHPYRIERMLLQLHQAGILQRQQALIVGECNDWKPSPLDNGYGLNEALAFIGKTSGVPVFTGLRFGHVADKTCLPVGRSAKLRIAEDGRASLFSSAV